MPSSPRKQICFRGEDEGLVTDGDCVRVYAAKRRFHADLSGDCGNGFLAETPGAVEGAYRSRAQLRAGALSV